MTRQARRSPRASPPAAVTVTDRYELTWRRRDGRAVPTLVSAQRVLDRDGRFAGSVMIVTNLTELKDLQAARAQFAHIEPPRVFRRPQLLRGRGYDKQDNEQVFA
ncbi:MAG: hypothetical protein ACYDD1_22440 [Caulobacteraceae bacterium]